MKKKPYFELIFLVKVKTEQIKTKKDLNMRNGLFRLTHVFFFLILMSSSNKVSWPIFGRFDILELLKNLCKIGQKIIPYFQAPKIEVNTELLGHSKYAYISNLHKKFLKIKSDGWKISLIETG